MMQGSSLAIHCCTMCASAPAGPIEVYFQIENLELRLALILARAQESKSLTQLDSQPLPTSP